jgi:hypothetical protein
MGLTVQNVRPLTLANADRGLVVRTFDEVAFPVTWQYSVINIGRSHVETDHVGYLSALVCAPRAWHAVL